MEMQVSAMPSAVPRLSEEDLLASQVVEIIGGITILQTLEEPEEKDVWSVEEGDDSVFLSDEEQPHLFLKACCDCGHLANSVTAEEPSPERDDDPVEEPITGEVTPEVKEVTRHVILSEQGEEWQQHQIPETYWLDQSEAADSGAEPSRCQEEPVSTCGEPLPMNCMSPEMQTQPDPNPSAETTGPPVEEAFLDRTQKPSDVPDAETYKKLDGEGKVSEQTSCAELKRPGVRRPQVDHQKSSPGYSTLPLPRKHSHQDSFDHLTSPKYSTASYRRIRRGNTRQKIETFEFMMMNL